MLDLALLYEYQHKPEPFTPGEPLFWNDPHISAQMLATHLDPQIDAASRKPDTIAACVAWILQTLDLKAGDALLDLGCGPGLYAQRFAQHGLAVSAVDLSPRSLAYARDQAEAHGLAIDYRCQDYLSLCDEDQYQAALLIFGDYCTFSPENRRRLLANIQRALIPGGYFVLDVSTRAHRASAGVRNGWYLSQGGFWRPKLHLVLEGGFDYPEQAVWLDQYIVVEEDGTVAVYRNWFQDFDRQSIRAELTENGFEVLSVWGDLSGMPYDEDGEWIGVVARWTPS